MAQETVHPDTDAAASPGRIWRGAALRHVAMPLGGIGTGQVALCGDGSLRQWELFNQPNHLGFVPDSFFAISAASGDDRVTRIELHTDVPPEPETTPSTSHTNGESL